MNQLQNRTCLNCEKNFRVLSVSKQNYCSQNCDFEHQGKDRGWRTTSKIQRDGKGFSTQVHGERRKVSRKGKKPIFDADKVRVEPKETLNERFDTTRTSNESEPENEPSTQQWTPSEEERETESMINEETKNDNESNGGDGMPETERSTTRGNEQEEGEEIRPTVSIKQFLTSEMVDSPSMSLLDDSAILLHGLMRESCDKQDIRPDQLKIEKIHAVCHAAKNIREIMKLKLEAMKLQHEINKETGAYDRRG